MCDCIKSELNFIPDPNCLVEREQIVQLLESYSLMKALDNYSTFSKIQLGYKITQMQNMLKSGNYCMYEI